MYFDFSKLNGKDSYKLLASTIVPRPIAWVVTVSASGGLNAAPFSFFNAFSGDPPIVCLGIGIGLHGMKDTLRNLQETGELVINMVSEANVAAMNLTAAPFPEHVDEMQAAGLTTCASSFVKPPRIAESPASFECRVRDIQVLGGPNHLVIAEVLAANIADRVISDPGKCRIDASKLELVGRMESPGWYVRTSDRFMLKQPKLGDMAMATVD
ncbi:flavin reductase family protein [Ramlibacter sp. G-1-2-2]|uniref:Flavin reductase family protein n=1 Tax=Ramlibacter agri TaxID=2728837 RepID=A0A848HEU9_9BURK|nr:flavin reductase family protein [Ramlibacter agri]NML48722.1 flavin reductase family protein [Ramlibacter agri]